MSSLSTPVLTDITSPNGSTTTSETASTTDANLSMMAREILAAVLIVVMMVGLLGNSLLCVVVYRKAAMRSAINLLVAQLALSDLLLSALVMPLVISSLFLPPNLSWNRELCLLTSFLQEVLVTLNICLLLAISVDRYLNIVHRKEKLNSRSSRIVIGLSWAFSLLTSIPPLLGWGQSPSFSGHSRCVQYVTYQSKVVSFVVVSCLVTRYIPMAVIVYSYVRILGTVRKKNTKVQHYSVGISVTQSSGATEQFLTSQQSQTRVSVCRTLRVSSTAESSSAVSRTACSLESKSDNYGLTATTSISSSSSGVSFVSGSSTVHLPYICCQSTAHELRPGSSDTTVSYSNDSFQAEEPGVHTGSVLKASALKPSSAPWFQATASTQSGLDSHTVASTSARHINYATSSASSIHSGPSPHPDYLSSKTIQNNHEQRVTIASSTSTSSASFWNPEQAGSRSYISSPSGFSPRASNARRTAGARRQVIDMSFKTRAFKTILILSLVLCLCWLPYSTALLVNDITQQPNPLLMCLLLWLGFFKTALNPIIYCIRIRKFREACKLACPHACYSCACSVDSFTGTRRVNPGAAYQCAEVSAS